MTSSPPASSFGCPAAPLLLPSAPGALQAQMLRYDPLFDELFAEVRARIVANGEASKADIGALVFWKHIQNAP